MKLFITHIKRDEDGKEIIDEIETELMDINLSHFKFFLEMEHKLNEISKDRFHINIKE